MKFWQCFKAIKNLTFKIMPIKGFLCSRDNNALDFSLMAWIRSFSIEHRADDIVFIGKCVPSLVHSTIRYHKRGNYDLPFFIQNTDRSYLPLFLQVQSSKHANQADNIWKELSTKGKKVFLFMLDADKPDKVKFCVHGC